MLDSFNTGHNNVVIMPKRSPVAPAEHIAAARFKATCLELMDHVREAGVEYVVTKHGEPVARLVPYTETVRSTMFGALSGSVLDFDRPLDPLDDEYEINRM
jgi:prevent-host-death family protein